MHSTPRYGLAQDAAVKRPHAIWHEFIAPFRQAERFRFERSDTYRPVEQTNTCERLTRARRKLQSVATSNPAVPEDSEVWAF